MERVRFIDYKGKKILLLDFSGCSSENVLGVIEEGKKLIGTQPKHSLLTLTDVKDAHFDSKVIMAMKEFVAHNKLYVRKGAVVGISGLQRIVYDSVMWFSGRSLPSFDDIEKAKDWLVSA